MIACPHLSSRRHNLPRTKCANPWVLFIRAHVLHDAMSAVRYLFPPAISLLQRYVQAPAGVEIATT